MFFSMTWHCHEDSAAESGTLCRWLSLLATGVPGVGRGPRSRALEMRRGPCQPTSEVLFLPTLHEQMPCCSGNPHRPTLIKSLKKTLALRSVGDMSRSAFKKKLAASRAPNNCPLTETIQDLQCRFAEPPYPNTPSAQSPEGPPASSSLCFCFATTARASRPLFSAPLTSF